MAEARCPQAARVAFEQGHAEQVFALVRESRPSVVLVDLLMPQMDGFEVIDRLRSDPVSASVKLLRSARAGRPENAVVMTVSGSPGGAANAC